ncbi:type IV conjugative transfer system lipoprotein TraV [Providencia rettgeri]|uniref:type IV conjugative transfer system lipoprotein TraV n=1 Tax=Providencia rettgeri TaxID=587 RepID=UPI00226F21FA|nr:type IV conjugative transfer system lipoprotein TraV [Providencia rettgeri]MCX9097513.1 type IV conjugative transfer system lipoprotein TraV [Providencia rettgeri]HCT9039550.1 type IV conjugative transfer system lipoprotein TraV [Providencia rettgeri]
MKKFLILGALTLLAGCTAGMKDSFDCNATAQDSCMTMEEANQKAAQQNITWNHPSNGEGTSQKRVELPRLAPLATPTVPVVTTASPAQSVRTAVQDNRTSLQTMNALGAFEQPSATVKKSVPPHSLPPVQQPTQTWSSWSDIGMAPPQRLPTTTARLWIAPWIDEQDNLYQPAVVSFVVKDGQWRVQ